MIRNSILGIGIIGLISTPFFAEAKPGEALQLRTFPSHSRLLIRVGSNVSVDFKNDQNQFDILLKGITLNDLGAPMGSEDQWKGFFRGIADSRLKSVDIREKKAGVQITGRWKFPTGNRQLANPVMEFFEYRKKNPSFYVIDFWVRRGKTKFQAIEESRKRKKHQSELKMKEIAKNRVERRLALERRTAEVADSKRYCDKPLSQNNDVFLEFFPVHEKFDFGRWLPTTTADREYTYFRPKSESEEAEYVRLAISLYEQGKTALTIKTLDLFRSKYPNSKYLLEMEFMTANAFIKLGLMQKAEPLFRKMISDHGESPFALYSAMYLAQLQLENQSMYPALQTFLWLIRNYPKHVQNWVFHLGAAEALYALNEVKGATKEYRWVIENAPSQRTKAEAAYRVGDLYQNRFQYERSLVSYFQAKNYFPKYVDRYPSYYLNRGEALFQMNEDAQAEAMFLEFLKKFPGHPEGWRAYFRLAEVHARGPKGSLLDETARGYFYDTINHYPLSPGATLARLRLIPCGDHGGFHYAAAERFFEQAMNFDGKEAVLMKDFQNLRVLSHIRSLVALAGDQEITVGALKELKLVRNPQVRDHIARVANEFFRQRILELLDSNKPYLALTFYSKLADQIPPPDASLEINYLLRLSRIASRLGMGKFGRELSEDFNRLRRHQKASLQSRARGLASKGITVDDIDTLEKRSEEQFTEAKAIWVGFGNNIDDENAARVRRLLAEVEPDSPHFREREIILGLVSQRKGDFKAALSHALKANMVRDSDRVAAWIAYLHEQHGDPEIAIDILENLEKKVLLSFQKKDQSSEELSLEAKEEVSLGLSEKIELGEVIRSLARVLEKKKDWSRVAEVYDRAIKHGLTQGSYRYALARALLKDENSLKSYERGKQVLSDMINEKDKEENKTDQFWFRLAQETLADVRSIETIQSINPYAKEGTL